MLLELFELLKAHVGKFKAILGSVDNCLCNFGVFRGLVLEKVQIVEAGDGLLGVLEGFKD